MKTINCIIALIILSVVVSAADYSKYEYYVGDKISGRNLVINQFDDELGIIGDLINSDMVKRDTNMFSGYFGYGILNNIEVFEAKDVRFSGEMKFNDASSVKYELIDFVPESTNVDEYGNDQASGTATLVYEATIKIRRSVPVTVDYEFYADTEDKSNFAQEIFIKGQDLNIHASDDGVKQRFNHQRKCYAGCEE